MSWEARQTPEHGYCIFEGERVVASLNSGFAFHVGVEDLAKMTAAPDLYAALEKIVFAIEDGNFKASDQKTWMQLLTLAAEGGGILAKARGER